MYLSISNTFSNAHIIIVYVSILGLMPCKQFDDIVCVWFLLGFASLLFISYMRYFCLKMIFCLKTIQNTHTKWNIWIKKYKHSLWLILPFALIPLLLFVFYCIFLCTWSLSCFIITLGNKFKTFQFEFMSFKFHFSLVLCRLYEYCLDRCCFVIF